MIIRQGHISQWTTAARFREMYNLKDYTDPREPLVVFGVYEPFLIARHRAPIVLVWCGNDTKIFNNWGKELKHTGFSHKQLTDAVKKNNVINVTALPKAKEYLESLGVECKLIRRITDEKPVAQECGNKIYTYLNKNKPQYHGSEIIEDLNTEYEIMTGDFSISPEEWKAGRCEEFYKDAFIGLFLSDYCGGGGSIIEMGLRGKRCVTNVFNYSHCIPWRDKRDIEKAIKREAGRIGKKDRRLAEKVYSELLPPQDGFDLEKNLI